MILVNFLDGYKTIRSAEDERPACSNDAECLDEIAWNRDEPDTFFPFVSMIWATSFPVLWPIIVVDQA